MLNVVIASKFTKIFFIYLFSYFINIKIINYRNCNFYKTAFIVIISILISLLYVFLTQYLLDVGAFIISYFVYWTATTIILNTNFEDNFASIIISVTIAYIIYLISTLLSGILLMIFAPNIDYRSPISLVTIPIMEALLVWSMFKIKRFRYGFNFLKNIETNKNLLKFLMNLSAIIILIFGFLQRDNNLILNTCLAVGTMFIAVILLIFVRDQITKQYKKNMRDRTIEIQKKEIDEQLKIIEEIKAENLKLAKAIHKYNSRLSALELGIKNTIEKNSKTEFADELSVILDEAHEISKGFSEETTINNKKLPLTNIIGIDNMFKYFQREANKNNINFDLIVNESINPLLEKIDKAKFETLIGDHLKDAIIAVSESKNSFKSILVILGIIENCYEFSVCDTGIEFEIDTLLKLGLEQVTTHKDTGGSGIGFITTFETLKECKASLIIEEYNPNTTTYTKSVTIRFDNKNKYKICSYRADEIKKKNKGNRIIIENL